MVCFDQGIGTIERQRVEVVINSMVYLSTVPIVVYSYFIFSVLLQDFSEYFMPSLDQTLRSDLL